LLKQVTLDQIMCKGGI